jgi:anti-sigma-K factor RskA
VSPERHQPSHEEYRDGLAAHALGALPEPEASELKRHLEECEACSRQLRWLQPAVELLPHSVQQLEPPPRLRRRLLETVRAEAAETARPGLPPEEEPRRRRWALPLWRPVFAVGAALLVLAGGVAGYLVHQPGESRSLISARPLFGAPGSLTGTLEREDGSAILRVSRLPALRGGDVYEVWVQRDGALQPSSLFAPRRDMTAAAAVPGPLGDADAVLVTREPRGGSSHPTSPPLLRADLR